MAWNPFTVIKSLLIKEENTLTPKAVEIVPGGTANTKTTIVASQTTNKTLTLPDATDTLVGKATTDTLTNKTFDVDGTGNSLTNVANANIKAAAAIDASKIADGTVSNTEFQYINSVTSNVQTQLDGKQPTGNYITALTGDVTATGPGSVAATISGLDATKIGAGTVDNTEFGYLNGVTSSIQTQISAKATTALDNLASTAVNASIVPATTDTINLGSASKAFSITYTNTINSIGAPLNLASANGASTNDVGFASGDASAGNSGDVAIFSGLATGTRGQILLDGRQVDVNNTKIVNLATPTDSTDAATKQYVDDNSGAGAASTELDNLTTTAINADLIFNKATPFVKSENDTASETLTISSGNASAGNSGDVVIQTGTATGTRGEVSIDATQVDVNNTKIVNLATPTNPTDAATKQYVDDNSGAGAATTELDNLTTTAINADLLPGVTNTIDLGSSSLKFKDIHVAGNVIASGSIQSPLGTNLTILTNTPALNNASDPVLVSTGNATGLGASGQIQLSTGSSATSSGSISIVTGTGASRGDLELAGRTIQMTAGSVNFPQGQTAVPVASQQALTIPSSGSTEGIPLLTASDSTVRQLLAVGPGGLPQAPNYIVGGDAEGKLTSSTSIFTPYALDQSVTFTDAGDLVTLASHGLNTGNTVSFTSITSTTGISVNTTYYVIYVSSSTFQVASTLANAQAGTALPLTTNGSGVIVKGIPVSGSGGSATVTSAVTSSAISGNKSYTLVKGASNCMGQGWAIDFSTPITGLGRALTIKFDYGVTAGTFVPGSTTTDSDVTVWIYDSTGSRIIQPTSYKLLSNSSASTDSFQAEFQTPVTGTDYRLVFHVATPSTSSYTLTVDNIVVSPSEYVFGTPISDWQTYAPTISAGFGSATNNSFKYRRIGDSYEIVGTFTSGVVAGSLASITLPNGASIDTTKVTLSNTTANPGQMVGEYEEATATANTRGVLVTATGTSSTLIYFGPSESNASSALTPANGSSVTGNSTVLSLKLTVPISGLSSSVQMADQTSTRIVAASYWLSSNQAVTANVTNIPFDSREIDTHSAYSSGIFTVPVPGTYEVKVNITETVSSNYNVIIYKNGSAYKFITSRITSGPANGSTNIQANANDTISIRLDANNTLLGNASMSGQGSNFSINRVSGPSQIAASETVAASYSLSANQTSNSTTPIPFNTKQYDTHNACTSGTGFRFTAPVGGLYSVGGNYIAGAGTVISVYKNGVAYGPIGVNSGSYVTNGTLDLMLLAGEYVDVRFVTSQTATGGAMGTANICVFTIKKVGNLG
jgi:hypothetical protein